MRSLITKNTASAATTSSGSPHERLAPLSEDAIDNTGRKHVRYLLHQPVLLTDDEFSQLADMVRQQSTVLAAHVIF